MFDEYHDVTRPIVNSLDVGGDDVMMGVRSSDLVIWVFLCVKNEGVLGVWFGWPVTGK